MRLGLPPCGAPGLWSGGLGEDVQPGEGAGTDGDFMWTGEAPAEPMTAGDLMEAAPGAVGPLMEVGAVPVRMPASCEGV